MMRSKNTVSFQMETGIKVVVLIGLLLFGLMSGCDHKAEQPVDESSTAIEKQEITEFQKELLQIAFDTASQIPAEPHIKDRSKAQQSVVDACLALNQPLMATAFANKIDNWRRGMSYANLAYYLAENGYDRQMVQKGLDMAELIAQIDQSQQWHRDRILAKINQTQILLDQMEPVDLTTASAIPPTDMDDRFNSQVKTYDDLVALGGHETTLNAVSGYSDLFTCHYDDSQRREMMLEKIESAWQKTPISIRLEILSHLTQAALDHNDQQMALELVNQSQTYIDDYQWPHDKRIMQSAKLLSLRFRCSGDVQLIRKIDELLTFYETNKNSIVSIYRTEALLPVAEAYQTMQRSDKALTVYKQAIAESVINPNSRPRAEDLSLICNSMATFAVEPDQTLWTRIRQIRQGLSEPW